MCTRVAEQHFICTATEHCFAHAWMARTSLSHILQQVQASRSQTLLRRNGHCSSCWLVLLDPELGVTSGLLWQLASQTQKLNVMLCPN